MEEKIPILYYNTIDYDIREEEKNRAIPPETSILKKRPPTLCFALVRSDRPQPFSFLFLPLSLRPTYLDIPPLLPPLHFYFFYVSFLRALSARGGKIERNGSEFCFQACSFQEEKKKAAVKQKKGKNICSPKTEEKTPP